MLLNLCAKWNKRGSFQKTTIYYSMLFNKRGIFQKTTIYYCMIFNLCAYWNETRGTVFKKKKNQQFITVCYSTRGAFFKKQQFITVWYSTCVRIEMKQDGQLSKKPNWWQYATELVREMKQEGQFSKTNNLLLYAIQLVCVLKWQEGQFSKNNNLLLYAIQMRKQEGQFSKTVKHIEKTTPIYYSMLFNKRGSFQKTTIYYCMIFNLCAYWNETRGTVFNNNLLKKNKITVCYSTCMHIGEMKQDGQFSKKSNLLQYAIQLVRVLKWNKSFQKTTVFSMLKMPTKNINYYSMLLWNNLCATCVCIEMKQEGQFSKTKQPIYYSMLFNKGQFWKTTIYYCMIFNLCAYWNETRGTVFNNKKNTNLLQYAIQLVRVLKWNKMVSFQKNPINDNMLLNLCAKWNKRGSFQKTTIYYSMLFNLCRVMKWNKRAVFKKIQFMTICY